MPIVAQAQPIETSKIYATRYEAQVDQQAILAMLADLSRRGSITDRDELLLEYLRELNVLSLDQVWRLLFSAAKKRRAYDRLWFLSKKYLVSSARTPRTEMRAWGLPVGKVYALGIGGRLWLREAVSDQPVRHLKRNQVLHDLLAAELCVRLVEAVRRRGEAWRLTWTGEEAAGFYNGDAPLVAPDGLAVVRQQRQGTSPAFLPLFVEMDASREAHGRPSSDWGRKVIGYDRFFDSEWKFHPHLENLPTFPIVAVVTHGEQRLLNLANAINEHRRQEVVYYLALWDDLLAGDDLLTVPAWLVVAPTGQIIGEKRGQRQPLLASSQPGSRKKSKAVELRD